MRNNRYTTSIIERAKKMRKEGFTIPVIVQKTGMKRCAVMWYTTPGYREKLIKRQLVWHKENRAHALKQMKERREKKTIVVDNK